MMRRRSASGRAAVKLVGFPLSIVDIQRGRVCYRIVGVVIVVVVDVDDDNGQDGKMEVL
jgi:hypothetical protein